MDPITLAKPPAAGQAAHTPTPWRVEPQFYPGAGKIGVQCYHGGADGAYFDVATVHVPYSGTIEANAAFIVRACNENAKLHTDKAALVAALESLVYNFEDEADPRWSRARAALNAAKEVQP